MTIENYRCGPSIEDYPLSIELSQHGVNNRNGRLNNTRIESLGYPRFSEWEINDYIRWYVDFRTVNEGLEPTEEIIDAMRKVRLAPHINNFVSVFQRFEYYLDLGHAEYQVVLAERQETNSEILMDIGTRLNNGSIPVELFDEAKSDEERITRYAKYVVANKLIPHDYPGISEYEKNRLIETKIQVAKGIAGQSFTYSIRKKTIKGREYSLTDGAIELEARDSRYFDIIYPNEHLKKLHYPPTPLA